MIRVSVVLVLVLLIIVGGSDAHILLKNCTVANVHSSPPVWVTQQSIHISSNIITRIEPTTTTSNHHHATVIDCNGRYVIPGLMDGHVHVSSLAPDEDAAVQQLTTALKGGVTSVRDMGGDALFIAPFAAQSHNNNTNTSSTYPRIYFSALVGGLHFFDDMRMTTVTHQLQQGCVPWLQEVVVDNHNDDDDDDAREKEGGGVEGVAWAAKAVGATAVKMYGDMPPSAIKHLSAAAHKHHVRTWAHAAVFPSKPSDCVEGGVDVISHSAYLVWEATEAKDMPMSYTERFNGHYSNVSFDHPSIKKLFKEMTQRRTILDATLYVFDEMGGDAYNWSCAVTRLAKEMGVEISAGTDDMMPDPTVSNLPNVHRELSSLVTCAGLTEIDAIKAATLSVARAIGADKEIGSLEVGKFADIVLLEEGANPSRNITDLSRIAMVIKSGEIVFDAASDVQQQQQQKKNEKKNNVAAAMKPLPTFAQTYTARESITQAHGLPHVTVDHYYDATLMAERVDLHPRNITRIYRYDLGVEYVIDTSQNTCSHVRLDVGALPPFGWRAYSGSLVYGGVVEGEEVWEEDNLMGVVTRYSVHADTGLPKQVEVISTRNNTNNNNNTVLVSLVYDSFDAAKPSASVFDVPAICKSVL